MRIFGFDIGTTSIGFAVIDLDSERQAGKIHRLGVRIFPEARDPDGTPLNQQRRAKRMMRRQLRRRRERRRSLNELLASAGLLPGFGGDEWCSLMKLDPYALRARGLEQPLSPYELGRALYHLSKHRHFKERELAEAEEAGTAEDDEETPKGQRKGKQANETKPKSEEEKKEEEQRNKREHFVAALKASGETLGQALANRGPSGPPKGGPPAQRKRGEHATRATVEAEFQRLVAAQAPHHAVLRDPLFRGAAEEAIFAQRPVFWRKSTLGQCRLMPGEPLCPKGSWLSQQRVMLEKVNNLAIVGGNARPLDEEEREAIVAVLATQKSMRWSGVRKALEPLFKVRGESTKYVHFNLEYGDEKGGLKGNVVEAAFAKIFGARWQSHSHKDALRRIVPEELWKADYGEIGTQRVVIRPEKKRAARRRVLAERLMSDFGASRGEAEAIVRLHFPQGWEPFSAKALEIFLPELEKGTRFGALLNGPDYEAWRDAHFPNREQPTGEILDRLPTAYVGKPRKLKQHAGEAVLKSRRQLADEETKRIATVRNPTVVRVQNEVRKVVNNLIGVYGKPDLIRVELAREVGKSKREREEDSARRHKNENMRKKAGDDLVAKGIRDPSHDDIEKWLLWKECGEECPYTGEKIGFFDLFGGNPRFEVEHIWPRSQSLDNGLRNKTLCRKDVNLAKGNRIPFQFFQGRPDDWQAAKDRIWKMTGKGGMLTGKAKRFCADKMPDDFARRQLNDTGYAARQAMAFLKRLWPDVGPRASETVRAVTGRVTAQLRRRWGLNNILADDGEKTRDDHRHHAIDALAVACAHRDYTQKLSHYFEKDSDYRRGRGPKPSNTDVPLPWPSIRADAERAVAAIVVSHRVRKKVSGPLHLETTYGDTGIDEKTKSGTYRLFVTRKPVERLSKGEIENIVDERVRTIVRDWVAAHGGDPKKAFATFPRVSEGGPEIRKVRLRSKQQLALMAPVSTGYANMANNHHVAIYRLPNGKADFQVVSLFEASRRLATHEPIVRREREDNATFVMSLCVGDTLRFARKVGQPPRMWRVQKIASKGQISLLQLTDASPKEPSLFEPTVGGIMSRNATKLLVDPIGRWHPAND